MSRHGFHSFTSSAPVFGQMEDDFDPFFDLADPAASPRVVLIGDAAEAFPITPLMGKAPDQSNEKEPH